ncbi:type II toxin-antitoxin system RelE/ParE family toxin [Paraburkholderia sp. J12]|uniref:type II toxin-antitoxin system RelE/ParE family toxin n=1 Tax=Paraburkholderia sp. J12 TaxID=2805432 RepID=UPI002ABE8768|nr:type II toxin-antitoxin system RelE/ParE family toxin [Paraburkholderia sp. J12]
MKKVVFLQSARAELLELRRYLIAKFGAQSWLETRRTIEGAVAQIEAFPLKGHTPPELRDLGMTDYYQVICGMNRIVYQVDGKVVYLHLIVDTRRDLKAVLAQRLFQL